MTAPRTEELLANLDWVRMLAARLVFESSARHDLEQEVWLAAMHSSPAPGVPMRAWLAGIAHNVAAMWRRSSSRRQRREHAAARDLVVASPADLAAQSELQQRLLAAVNALPADMRDVVLLRDVEGLPPRAIARQLEIPVATVRTRLSRAHLRLREALDAEFGDRRTWLLALAALPRARHVAAAAGTTAVLTHLGVALVQTHKLILASTVLLALAAIPTTFWLIEPSWPVAPDFTTAAPVAAAFDRAPHAATSPEAAPAAIARSAATQPSATFTGRVVDGDGTPIAGASIGLWPDWHAESHRDEGATERQVRVTSAADGTFEMTPLRHEKWGVFVAATHAEHFAVERRTQCVPGQPATIVMQRVHEVPLTVEVHDARSGLPVPRFHVVGTTSLRAAGSPDSRDASGANVVGSSRDLPGPERGVGVDGVFCGTARFVAGLPYQVLAQCPGDGRDGFGDHNDPVPRATLQPQPGEPIHLRFEVAFGRVEGSARVVQRGRVVDAKTDTPIPGVRIGWRRNAKHQNYRYVQSRADGTFALALPDDGVVDRLRVAHDDFQPQAIGADAARELTIRMLGLGSMRCRVVDDDGQPIADAPLLIKAERDDDLDLQYFQERRRTDSDGCVELTGLAERSYWLNLLRRMGDADDQALVTVMCRVRADECVEQTLRSSRPDAVRVIGTIAGGPDGLEPMFVPLRGERRWVRAQCNGRRYDAGGVPRGEYLVLLLPAEDDGPSGRSILLPRVTIAGLTSQALDLLVPDGAIRGRVVGDESARADLGVLAVPDVPADGLAAELLGNAKAVAALGAPIAADGTFTLPHLADGPWRLQLRAGATVLADRAITLTGTLDLGDWVLPR